MNGSNVKMFEQHLSEIIWRSHVNSSMADIYTSFFDLVKSVFSLESAPSFTYPTPLFNTWTPPAAGEGPKNNITIIQGSDVESDEEDTPSSQSVENNTPAHALQSATGSSVRVLPPSGKPAASGSAPQEDSDNGDDELLRLFCPKGFKPMKTSSTKKDKEKRPKRGKKPANPYSKSAFVFDFSDNDSDFE